MKASTSTSVALLYLSAHLTQAFMSGRRAVNASSSGSAYLNIQNSSNTTLDNLWGYVDPDGGTGISFIFQFTADKAKATNFSITSNNYLSGFKSGYISGGTNAEGTASGAAIYVAPRDLFVHGGEPILNAYVDDVDAHQPRAVSLNYTLGDGLYRHIPQACHFEDGDIGEHADRLPVLVVGEKYFDTNGCANITLFWVPVDE
ncbi:hypothetical protein DV738_g990, partial [Chaetothyriales sp. CBS 135597]